MRGLVLLAMMAFGVLGAGAQTGSQASATIEPAMAFDALLANFEKEVVGAAKAMPADKYGFSPESLHIPGAQFTGVRTFAGEVTHLAQVNYSIAAGLTGKKPTVNLKALVAMTSKEQCVKALEDSFLAAHQAVATVTVANENDSVGAGVSKASLAAYISVHGFDHYGQMVEYLRMNGIVPPASAK